MSKDDDDDGADAAAPRGEATEPVFELLVLICSDEAEADMVGRCGWVVDGGVSVSRLG